MGKRIRSGKGDAAEPTEPTPRPGKPSALLDTRVIYCGDNLEQLAKLPPQCIDLIYIDPPFNSNRNYEVFWGETKEKRAFEDRHESTSTVELIYGKIVFAALISRSSKRTAVAERGS
jgi:hypothetical protein